MCVGAEPCSAVPEARYQLIVEAPGAMAMVRRCPLCFRVAHHLRTKSRATTCGRNSRTCGSTLWFREPSTRSGEGALYLLQGTWCSDIAPAQHAGDHGFKPQRVHDIPGHHPTVTRHTAQLRTRTHILNEAHRATPRSRQSMFRYDCRMLAMREVYPAIGILQSVETII